MRIYRRLLQPALLGIHLAFLLALMGCREQEQYVALPAPATVAATPAATSAPETITPSPTAFIPGATSGAPVAMAAPTDTAASPSATPFFFAAAADCGESLPLLLAAQEPPQVSLAPDSPAAREALALVPDAARPALLQLLQAPETVGLAAYRAGDEANGAFLNADAPMPLASVVKIMHLIAYAEAVDNGELSPITTVPLSDVEKFYQPTLDLSAHRQAVEALEADGRLFGQPPALLLDEVVRMMVEYSANAATDYLHLLLGQARLEETAARYVPPPLSAPCPFLGQFLAMANHTRPEASGRDAFDAYISDPARYGQEVVQYTLAFSQDEAFREQAIAWRRSTRRPAVPTQRLFSEQFNAQGTAATYAALMAQIAQNGLGSPQSAFTIRRHLEWPMRFPVNQEQFSNLGYKGGSLPGILTTAYYAYPIGETTPVVVALFYRDLPDNIYRRWRRSQAHDEFARWLLADPQAIPALQALLSEAQQVNN